MFIMHASSVDGITNGTHLLEMCLKILWLIFICLFISFFLHTTSSISFIRTKKLFYLLLLLIISLTLKNYTYFSHFLWETCESLASRRFQNKMKGVPIFESNPVSYTLILIFCCCREIFVNIFLLNQYNLINYCLACLSKKLFFLYSL